jgi:hypothetical protein
MPGWDDVDKDETCLTLFRYQPGLPFLKALLHMFSIFPGGCALWGDAGMQRAIESRDDVVIIIGLMENDCGSIEKHVVKVEEAVDKVLKSHQPQAVDHRVLAGELQHAIVDALDDKMGCPNGDDLIEVRELVLTTRDLKSARRGSRRKTLVFKGDGGKYTLQFRLCHLP